MISKNSKQGIRFTDLISQVVNGNELSIEEKEELDELVNEIGMKSEIEGEKRCVWICKGNNWSCNPNSPPPNCKCYKFCY